MRLLIILLFISFSVQAQPQFFAKELNNIPSLDNGIMPGLCGGEANWDCYFDTFYELWGNIVLESQIVDFNTTSSVPLLSLYFYIKPSPSTGNKPCKDYV